MKAIIATALAFPVLFLVLLVIPIVGGQDDVNAALSSCDVQVAVSGTQAAACGCGLGGVLNNVSSTGPSLLNPEGGASTSPTVGPELPPSKVKGFTAEQVKIATTIVATGKALNVPPRGIAIGIMTAYGESNLRNINYGDRDSIGIFQQRGNGAWGSRADRMNPAVASANFFKALTKVPGWEGMEPTLAAHAAQVNADPYYYQPYWDLGLKLYSALEGTLAAKLANPDVVTCAVAGPGTSDVQFTPSGIAYVGAFPPDQLRARAEKFVQAGKSDPYFHANGGTWYRKCQRFVANLSGRIASGFPTASDGWAHAVATKAAHPATAPDGQSPPVGAWLYFKDSNPAGHVTVYLGDGLAAGTDLPTSGQIGIVAADAPVTKWGQTYLGWVAPWGAPNTGSKGA